MSVFVSKSQHTHTYCICRVYM